MTVEVEPHRLKQGEGKNRQVGGHVANTPFTRSLFEVMQEAGFLSQNSLTKALGKRSNGIINAWVTGKRFPSPQEVGNTLIVFDQKGVSTNSKALDAFLNAYGDELAARELKRIGVFHTFERESRQRRSIDTPVSQWIEKYCQEQNISLARFFKQIGCQDLCTTDRGRFGLPVLRKIEQEVRSKLGEEIGGSFTKAMDSEIQTRQRGGQKVRITSVFGMNRMQRESKETLYNGRQVADLLDTTRASVSKYRKRLGWGKLLTEGQVGQLGRKMEENRAIKGHKILERKAVFSEA